MAVISISIHNLPKLKMCRADIFTSFSLVCIRSHTVNRKTHILRQHSQQVAAEKGLQGQGDGNQGTQEGLSTARNREETLDIEGVMSRFFS